MALENHTFDRSELERRIASNHDWYHTLKLAPGVITPGIGDHALCSREARRARRPLQVWLADEQYGIPSMLACDVRVLRPVARTVFSPVPNVDSALVELRRRAPAAAPELRSFVQAAFAHRRKALARSLALAVSDPDMVPRARAALERLGHPANERAERLSSQEFFELWQALR